MIERLKDDWEVHAVWFNPNIQPAAEHDLRLEAARTVAKIIDVPLTELGCDPGAWHEACEGMMHEPEGGRRCNECFRLRLERVAAWACEQSIATIATTLSISPHKPAGRINEIGREAAERHGRSFLARDFKQDHGFQRSVELSRLWDIYRQSYCGCMAAQ